MISSTFLLPLLVTLLASPAMGAFEVVNKAPPDGTVVREGRGVRLSCRTNSRWFFCLWKTPGGDKQCAIQENTPRNVCKVDPRLALEGGVTNCDITINDVRREDHGRWMCLVADPENFDQKRTAIALEVGVMAEVRFDPGFGIKNELTVTEGEQVKIRCAALNGYPAARISWEEPKGADIDFSAQPQSHNGQDHTRSEYHTITYKADLKDDGREITCVATQVDRDGRTILFEASTSLKLNVEKLILPVDNALTQKIGIISGVLLAIIFLILLLIFCIFVVCNKRRRKRSRPPSSQATTEEDDAGASPSPPIKPIWTTPKPLLPAMGGGGRNGSGQQQPRRQHDPRQMNDFTNLLEPDPGSGRNGRTHHGHHHGLGNGASNKAHSQGTVSTRSTASQNSSSWDGEEDRSVGGEVELEPTNVATGTTTAIVTPKARSPSLHETHFGSDLDLPRTVLHHPDPYQQHQQPPHHSREPPQQYQPLPYYQQVPPHLQQPYNYPPATSNTPQQPFIHGRHSIGSTARPASSSAEHSPYYPYQSAAGRPTSAMSFPHDSAASSSNPPLTPRPYMATPNSTLTTSAKSVFDCELGCFVGADGEGSVHSADCPHSRTASNSSRESSMQTVAAAAGQPTSEPKEV